jgi:hypothetical protein
MLTSLFDLKPGPVKISRALASLHQGPVSRERVSVVDWEELQNWFDEHHPGGGSVRAWLLRVSAESNIPFRDLVNDLVWGLSVETVCILNLYFGPIRTNC